MIRTISSPTTTYVVDELLTKEGAANRIYLVVDQSDAQWYFMKVSPSIAGNGALDREVLLLKDIATEVKRIRTLEPEGTKHGGYRFEKCFPSVHESFLHQTNTGNQRINIIAVPAADRVTDLMPIEQYRTRERVWIDPKTSAWMLGRMLKIFTLVHPIGIAVERINGGNVLVRPGALDERSHRLLFFDWTHAHQYERVVPPEKVGEEIAQAATTVFKALGGNLVTNQLPASDQLTDNRYEQLLMQLMSGRERDPEKTRAHFYKVINDIWESAFHPFTTIPIKKGD